MYVIKRRKAIKANHSILFITFLVFQSVLQFWQGMAWLLYVTSNRKKEFKKFFIICHSCLSIIQPTVPFKIK